MNDETQNDPVSEQEEAKNESSEEEMIPQVDEKELKKNLDQSKYI
jgi:hypothetical protein